jgi:hypothetical protein
VRKAIAHQSAVQKDRLRQSSAGQAEASVGPGLPQDAPGLAGELKAIEGAQTYAHSLQVGPWSVFYYYKLLKFAAGSWVESALQSITAHRRKKVAEMTCKAMQSMT